MDEKNQKSPRTEQEKRDAAEANKEMKEKFREGEKDDLPANRVGGLRGNPS